MLFPVVGVGVLVQLGFCGVVAVVRFCVVGGLGCGVSAASEGEGVAALVSALVGEQEEEVVVAFAVDVYDAACGVGVEQVGADVLGLPQVDEACCVGLLGGELGQRVVCRHEVLHGALEDELAVDV